MTNNIIIFIEGAQVWQRTEGEINLLQIKKNEIFYEVKMTVKNYWRKNRCVCVDINRNISHLCNQSERLRPTVTIIYGRRKKFLQIIDAKRDKYVEKLLYKFTGILSVFLIYTFIQRLWRNDDSDSWICTKKVGCVCDFVWQHSNKNGKSYSLMTHCGLCEFCFIFGVQTTLWDCLMCGITQENGFPLEKRSDWEKYHSVWNKKFENQKLIGWCMAEGKGVDVWVCEVDQNWAWRRVGGGETITILGSPHLILFTLAFLKREKNISFW